MENDPRILFALIERDLANVQSGIAELGGLLNHKAPTAAKRANKHKGAPRVEEDPKRLAMRQKMSERAKARWAAIRAQESEPPKRKRQRG